MYIMHLVNSNVRMCSATRSETRHTYTHLADFVGFVVASIDIKGYGLVMFGQSSVWCVLKPNTLHMGF